MKKPLKPKRSLKERNAEVERKAKNHKVKVIYKYADEIYVDRPRRVEPPKDVIKTREFRDELVALCIRYLRKVKKSDLALALCQLQDQASIFNLDTKERIMKGLQK